MSNHIYILHKIHNGLLRIVKSEYFAKQIIFSNPSSIEHGGTRPFFHMMDQYFGNDSLEPFESKFIGSTGLAMVYLWFSWPSLMRGYETIFQCVRIFVRIFVGIFLGIFC